jgi:hypothetical protein
MELAALWNIGKFLWEQDIVKVRGALERQWPQRLAPLIENLRDVIISRGIQEVIKAYSVISIEKLQDIMMKTRDETVEGKEF